MAFNIRLTTARVVCQNTLSVAMREKKFGEQFRRGHSSTFREHATAAKEFFSATLKEIEHVTRSFTSLSEKQCDATAFGQLLDSLLPEPKAPRNADANPGLKRAWEKKIEGIRAARKKIEQLRHSGKGMQLKSAAGTYWGALNAILEYIDHYKDIKNGQKLSYALLGDGADLKTKAFDLIQKKAQAAA